MAWIAFYQTIEKHPKTLQLSQKTGWTVHETIGKLACLWFWALDYAEDGDLGKYQPYIYLTQLKYSGTPSELYKLFQDIGFIDEKGLINNWLEYVGNYLISKYKTSNPNKLIAIWKKHKTPLRRSLGGSKGGLKVAHIDKIDNIDNQHNKPTNNHFESVWNDYPKKVGKKEAERHYNASVKTDEDRANIHKALKNYKTSARVLRGIIQDGSTWFNNWPDWVHYTETLCPKCKGQGTYMTHGEGGSYKATCTCPAGKR